MANYNPKIDLVFRKLFGSEENADILLSLINGIIAPSPQLTGLTVKNPYNLSDYIGGKASILDIKAIDQNGAWYDIEMQIGQGGMYGKRALYYLSKLYVDQLDESGDFSQLNKTIGIHLIDFDYLPDSRYRKHFVYKDMETNEHIEHLSYHQLYFIEMTKFRKEWNEISSLLDRWIAFLNKAQGLALDALPDPLNAEPEIVQAAEKLRVMGLDKVEKGIYEGELKAMLVYRTELRAAREEGLAEGAETGIAKGREEGRVEGREQGRLEGREETLREAVHKLVESGMSEQEARKILGLA